MLDVIPGNENIVVFFITSTNPRTATPPDNIQSWEDLHERFKTNERVIFKIVRTGYTHTPPGHDSPLGRLAVDLRDDYYRKVIQDEIINTGEGGGNISAGWIYVDDNIGKAFTEGTAQMMGKKSGGAVCLGYEGPEVGASSASRALLEDRRGYQVILAPEQTFYDQPSETDIAEVRRTVKSQQRSTQAYLDIRDRDTGNRARFVRETEEGQQRLSTIMDVDYCFR